MSCVQTITDKPVPSRARATLPENYLSINKMDDGFGVFAKKSIAKSTQFGPLEGNIVSKPFKGPDDKLDLFVDKGEGKIDQLDISDES